MRADGQPDIGVVPVILWAMRFGRARRMKFSSLPVLSALCCGFASAQSTTPADRKQNEAAAILEIGAAPAWHITDGGSTLSPTMAVEFTVLKKWLEIEVGVTPTFHHRSSEWSTDVLFKKPWTLSRKVELMFGTGPEWIRSRTRGAVTNAAGAEIALDFMFWPTARRRFGWYLEPACDYSFGPGHEKSAGWSAGLLIAIP